MDFKQCCNRRIKPISGTTVPGSGLSLRNASSVTHQKLFLLQSATTPRYKQALAIIFGVKKFEMYLIKTSFHDLH